VNSLPKEAQDALLNWLRAGWNPMGRPGTPADIGGAVAALCAEDAGWITGQTIIADGGTSLMSTEVPLAFQRPNGQGAGKLGAIAGATHGAAVRHISCTFRARGGAP